MSTVDSLADQLGAALASAEPSVRLVAASPAPPRPNARGTPAAARAASARAGAGGVVGGIRRGARWRGASLGRRPGGAVPSAAAASRRRVAAQVREQAAEKLQALLLQLNVGGSRFGSSGAFGSADSLPSPPSFVRLEARARARAAPAPRLDSRAARAQGFNSKVGEAEAGVAQAVLRRVQSSVKSKSAAERRAAARSHDTIQVDGLFDPVTLAPPREESEASPRSPSPAAAPALVDLVGRQASQQDVYEAGGAHGLDQFKKGFLKFKKEVIVAHADHFRSLASSQHPKVMVIACCDSRVDPALLMGAGPGDIFIVRNIANLVPPFERQGSYHGTSAALEYAVTALRVEHIVVMGHQNCGGIKALMQRQDASLKNDFIDKWMEIASTACERTRLDAGHLDLKAQCSYCERESVNVSLANLLTFPWIKDAVSRRTLQLHGWCARARARAARFALRFL